MFAWRWVTEATAVLPILRPLLQRLGIAPSSVASPWHHTIWRSDVAQTEEGGVPDEIQLRRRWTLGGRIGDASGFGKVFEATCEDGSVGVVKLVPKEPGAAREMLFEELAGVPNVVPIVDVGETDDAWALAMPRAETSLRAHLGASGGVSCPRRQWPSWSMSQPLSPNSTVGWSTAT